MGKPIIAAAVHSAPVFMDKAATLKKVVSIVENAKASKSVDFLVFPETFVPGYPVRLSALSCLCFSLACLMGRC